MRHCFEQPDLPALAFRRALGKNRPVTLEGGKGGSAPSAPDPYTVAGATTQTNQATAAYNKALNLNNYSNPFGSQQTVQTGTDPNTGAPIYSTNTMVSQQLTGGLQNAFDQIKGNQSVNNNSINGLQSLVGSEGNLNGQLYGLGGAYSNINNGLQSLQGQLSPAQAAAAQQQGQNAAYAAQTQYLNPQFSQEQTSLESQLANQGLTPGSQAYTNAMTNFNNAKQQAYSNAANESILTGTQVGAQELQNQIAGINTQAGLYGQQSSNLGAQAGLLGQEGSNLGATASMLGQQASLAQLPYSDLQSLAALIPGNTGTASSAASPANIAQAFQNQYAGQLQQYNTNVASANSTQSGLFGLGTAGMLALALA